MEDEHTPDAPLHDDRAHDDRAHDERTLDELIAELNAMRGRMDLLRQLAHALIYSHPEPKRLAEEWFRAAPPADAPLDPTVKDQYDAIDARMRRHDTGDEPAG